MGIFDAFTGAPAKEAAASTRKYLTDVQQLGTNAINTAKTAASGYVDQGAAGATGAYQTGMGGAVDAYGQAYNTGTGAVNTGYGNANGYYDKAAGAYAPLSTLAGKYGKGTDTYLSSLGIGDPAAAQAAFHAGPGYQFALDQGIEGINRGRNARHMLNSGNTDRDALKFSQGLADQEYGRWQDRLAGLVQPELSATGQAAAGQAGVYGQQAGAAAQQGNTLADIAARYGTQVGGATTAGYGNIADTAYRTGTTQAGLETGAAGQQVQQATALAPAYSNTYGQEAAAQQQGSANLWGLGQSLATLGAKAYGGGFGPPKYAG